MRRHSHDGSCAVTDEHIVGYPDRKLVPCDRIDRICAGEDTRLLRRQFRAVHITLTGRSFLILLHRFALRLGRDLIHERMLR